MALEIEQHGRQLHAGEAVSDGVVELWDQSHVPALEPVDDPYLPQRPSTIEGLRHEPGSQLEQLGLGSGGGEGGVAHVPGDVEVRVVDP